MNSTNDIVDGGQRILEQFYSAQQEKSKISFDLECRLSTFSSRHYTLLCIRYLGTYITNSFHLMNLNQLATESENEGRIRKIDQRL